MKMNVKTLDKKSDSRGWLVENESELIRDSMRHFLVSSSEPGVVRGQHYHKRKTEWFLVIEGKAKIYFKDINSSEESSMEVNSDSPQIIEVLPNIAHSIENIGKSKMILLGIVNEPLSKEDPDTFSYKVI